MVALSRRLFLGGAALASLGGGSWVFRRAQLQDRAEELYATPLSAPSGPMQVYHLGHSLVGRDMPAMLAQLAGAGHSYHSQTGWGSSLRDHWEPDVPVNGFERSNDHAQHRPARAAIGSGDYGAVVLTEMVEIADAIRYHDSPDYLAHWARLAHAARPDIRVYLYETWHHTDDGHGWLKRIDRDLNKYWRRQVIYPALLEAEVPIHLIPAGQVMAAFVRAVDAAGGVGGIISLHDLFSRDENGRPDTIHFNDQGAYLVALTHYATLYHRDPAGLPHELLRADGTPAQAPSAEAARLMQRVVWDVVRAHPDSGVAA
ncbi:hypothetical protein HKX23_06405 [Sulfitobacter sp. KE29]|uniref:hypothetical protein n=1 Tax=unclassified Sulfitobacter TaxID=196795 RepID=UPI0007C2EFE7|nr:MULTISPECIES: hypothetical protein [unclassified Sulfitobacter]KZY52876.1 hypothetical protein A3734_17715 [Sulfitobacter sp. HI0054]MBO9438772.1 hypothetical protein [Sulfitobacter sp. R18_2]MDF3417981.1 hypothetical protein [Sulfitobacter sp. Ks38]MDF3425463.1 hypothetical protein [Sulfitobacter sp. KE29]MDF3429044.1 hypothetical protein [Sulfitobacter sp. S46]